MAEPFEAGQRIRWPPGTGAWMTVDFARPASADGWIIYAAADGDDGFRKLTLSAAEAAQVEILQPDGGGSSATVLAGLWTCWMATATFGNSITALALSSLRPYAHQLHAVYRAMLPQPRLRFLLADEPGTGKTIMAGLYLSEMRRLGLIKRVLIVAPAGLVSKWQADFDRFFGGGLRRVTATTAREQALSLDHDLWVVSLELAAANGAVQDAIDPDRASLPDQRSARSSCDTTVLAAETRDRAEYYAELHATVTASSAVAEQASDARDCWDGAARFADQWGEHERRWPSLGRPAAIPPDEPGSWRGDGGRALDATANKEVDQGYERIREIERDIITPAIRQIDAAESGRELAGFNHRMKGEDRLKEKVADQLEARPGLTAAQALSAVPDAVRFTFCYKEDRYADCVRADLGRLHSQGFELVKPLKNSWASEQYKGINSQWRDADTGQRFEVQFHTEASLKAKELTHTAYERIRNPDTSDAEHDELENFQHQVSAKVPVPPGASEIVDHPWKET